MKTIHGMGGKDGSASDKNIVELTNEEAREHFLKGSSYFNAGFPKYISFEATLTDVAAIRNGNEFTNEERICKIVNGGTPDLWENGWIVSKDSKNAINVSSRIVGSVLEVEEVIQPEEIELFKQNAWAYSLKGAMLNCGICIRVTIFCDAFEDTFKYNFKRSNSMFNS